MKTTFLILTGLFLSVSTVSAQVTFEDLGSTFGLGSADLENTVINIVQWALGLLALVAVVIIIWAGVLIMTGGGGKGEEGVERAKQMIIAAVIGLIIVLLAWAIVIFVVGTTSNVTE